MSIQVLPLKGYNAITAMNTFHRLLLGLKMLPMYITEDYVTFYDSFNHKTEAQKETLLREAVAFVKLDRDELEAIVSLAKDKNGIQMSAINLKKMDLEEIFETVVAVGMAISQIKIRLVSEDEKKKLANFSVDVRRQYLKHPHLDLEELLNLAFLEAVQGVQ